MSVVLLRTCNKPSASVTEELFIGHEEDCSESDSYFVQLEV
jgi:hypothetical protein